MSHDTQIGLPGARTARTSSHRHVMASERNLARIVGLVTISGTASADAGNTSAVRTLRAGKLMGQITSGGKWAPSILGVTSEAMTGAETDLDLPEAVGDELVRRQGASGTFKLTGPPTAAGTVRTLTVAYSAVAAAGSGLRVATITAMGVADVWTLTAPAGQDAGMYQLEVTTGLGTSAEVTATTAALAANANTATVDAAVEALANVGVGGVAAVYSDPTLTLTFASNLGPVHVRVISDTTNDGGVFEGGWAAVHTTTGVDGRFVTGSYVQPTDGSEDIMAIIGDGWGIKCTDEDGTSVDIDWTAHQEAIVGGWIDTSQIIDISSDTSLLAWTKAQLREWGTYWFDDDYQLT